jgi:hypothetical protein
MKQDFHSINGILKRQINIRKKNNVGSLELPVKYTNKG